VCDVEDNEDNMCSRPVLPLKMLAPKCSAVEVQIVGCLDCEERYTVDTKEEQ